jgi:aminobenzoyl-glutamate utilization protein A
MSGVTVDEDLRRLRRDLHRHPEPAWREFYTTARILAAIDDLDLAALAVGPEALDADARSGVPDAETLAVWRERARENGVEEDVLDALAAGQTGLVATLAGSEPGPTVALRVDIDGLPRAESTDESHAPVAEGFRSDHPDAMHACGHDAHATIGVGVLRRLAAAEFPGTVTIIFQPAEEVIGGGRAVAAGGLVDDVDYLLALHVGLDHPTGEIVAGIGDFLAVSQFEATFEGEPAHAGAHPSEGRNAMQAMATAVQNLYAIPRHEEGATRVNAGTVAGGTASNIVAESVTLAGEVRGETTALMEYMDDRARTVLESAAAMHDCEVTVEFLGEAPSAESDGDLVDVVAAVAGETAGVDSVVDRAPLGGSEDATYLMDRVQERGGLATYVCVGTDHPGGHHTATFDVDEASIQIGVDLLSEAMLEIARTQP